MAVAYANPIPAPEFMEPDGTYSHEGYAKRCAEYRASTEAYIRRDLGGRAVFCRIVSGLPQHGRAAPERAPLEAQVDAGDVQRIGAARLRPRGSAAARETLLARRSISEGGSATGRLFASWGVKP